MADRKAISRNSYLVPNAEGDIVLAGYEGIKFKAAKSPDPTATIIRTEFVGGSTYHLDAAKMPDAMRHNAMLQGFSIKLQRSFAEAKGNVTEAEEQFLTVRENIENGIWNTEREGGGPRISLLVDAVMRTLVEAKRVAAEGDEHDARRETVKAKLLTEEGRKVAMADVKVQSHFEAIKYEKAQERMKAAKAAAKDTKVSDALADF